MEYKFDLNRIRISKGLLDDKKWDVPNGKQPRDLWKNPISLVENSGVRNKIFSKSMGIVNHNGTVEEAYNSLMKFANDNVHKEVRNRFLTEKEIYKWAEWLKGEFEKYSFTEYDVIVYYDFIVWYYVVKAFNGFRAEYVFSDWLNSKMSDSTCYYDENVPQEILDKLGCSNKDELDRKLMIDLFVDNDCAIQIKSRSFLLGGGYSSFDVDYNALKKAVKNLKEKFNVNYFFAFYDDRDGELKWLKKDKENRYLFTSQEIFSLFDEHSISDRKRIVNDRLRRTYEYKIDVLK